LTIYFEEPLKLVKNNVGFLIGFVASEALFNNNWNQLLQIIQEQTQLSKTSEEIISGLNLLAAVIESSGDCLKLHYSSFFQFFTRLFDQPSTEVPHWPY